MSFVVGQLRCVFQKLSVSRNEIFMQTRNFPLRKHTRERKQKIWKANRAKNLARMANEARLLGYDPKLKNFRRKFGPPVVPEYLEDKEYERSEPTDDVYVRANYRWEIYSIADAIEAHRQVLHPTILNAPDAMLKARFELSMIGVKKTKPMNAFSRIAAIPHHYDHGEERQIAVFCKSPQVEKIAKDNGIGDVFGVAAIKDIAKGDVSMVKYSVILAHPEIVTELMTIKGQIKKLYPNVKDGTLNADLAAAIDKYLHGIKYSGKPCEGYKEHGICEIAIGPLSMDVQHLEENFATLLRDLESAKPKRPGPFVLRTCLVCPPNTEKYKIDFEKYLVDETVKEESDDEDDSAVIPSF